MRWASWGTAALLALACAGANDGPLDSEDPGDWQPAQQALAELGPGFVVWESNRSGDWRIWMRNLDGDGLRQLSPDEPDRDHYGVHVSPDGTRVVYLSYARPWNSYREPPRDEPAARLMLLDVAEGTHRAIAPEARAYGESRSAVWIDARSLVYLDARGDTRRLDLDTGEDTLLAKNGPGGPFLLNPTFTHGTSNAPSFSLYRAETGDFQRQPYRDGCQPYFTRDGRFGFWTSRAGGPIQRMELWSERMSTVVERNDARMPEAFPYLYFPMVSPGQRVMAFGASRGEHDHFRADYEIFIAPIDSRTLELVADPVRYTFHEATDRFPDVFVSGIELGHIEGEAPLPVALDASRARLDFPVGAVLDWDFGDGTTSRAIIGRHVYETPGRYHLEARLDGERVTAAYVDVDEPKPPEPLRSFQRGDELLIEFDEPIDAEVAELRFESGARATEWFVGPDGNTLHLRTDRRLEHGEVLELTGIRDRGAVRRVLPTRRIPVEPSTWPMDATGLVFSFSPEDGAIWRNPGRGTLEQTPLEAVGRARRDRTGALHVTGGGFRADDSVARAIGEACRGSEFSVEAVLATARHRQAEDTRIMSLERDDGRDYLALKQEGTRLRLRLRTDDEKVFSVGNFDPDTSTHFLVSYESGHLSSFRDGRKVQDTDRATGEIDWREASRLTLGAGLDGGKWRGRIERFAVYCRAIHEAEAANNAHAALELLRQSEPVPSVAVRATLRAVAAIPSLEEILPYKEGLVMASWQVDEVLSGELGVPEVRVAHWAWLNGHAQEIGGLELGHQTVLHLEPFADQPQVEALFLSDTLDFDPTVPVFLDVRP